MTASVCGASSSGGGLLWPILLCFDGVTARKASFNLSNGGTLENAQNMAAHESPRTTKLYDRTGDEITLDEVEKIMI